MTVSIDPNISNGRELTRLVWTNSAKELLRKSKVIETGFYCFGGIDESGSHSDDLYWIQPDFKANESIISKKHGDYKPNGKPEVKLVAKKL